MKPLSFEDSAGITFPQYQNRALECVSHFLAAFQSSPKTQSKKLRDNESVPVTLRVGDDPPSVQILQLPKGGIPAGELRISEKLSSGVIPAKAGILVAHEEDLTRECIIVTLNDNTVDAIIQNELVAPHRIAELLEKIRRGHPNFFIVVQRYIMGIERKSGLKVPYSIVEESDEKTFHYLEKLPSALK